jgi:hypothetical protein
MQRSEAYWKKRQECLEQGCQEGRLDSQQEIAIAALREGYPPEVINQRWVACWSPSVMSRTS